MNELFSKFIDCGSGDILDRMSMSTRKLLSVSTFLVD